MRRLTIGQPWRRRRDKVVATVWQVHRRDRIAELRTDAGERINATFDDLRNRWRPIA